MLADLQKVLVACCMADDPVAALHTARREHPELAATLDHLDADGLRLTSLLVKKLRFERILRGDRQLQDRFHANPTLFTTAFRHYLGTEPPTCVFPQEEAQRFQHSLDSKADSGS